MVENKAFPLLVIYESLLILLSLGFIAIITFMLYAINSVNNGVVPLIVDSTVYFILAFMGLLAIFNVIVLVFLFRKARISMVLSKIQLYVLGIATLLNLILSVTLNSYEYIVIYVLIIVVSTLYLIYFYKSIELKDYLSK